jgi:mRNA-degrading endonuclease HigB of HigAB toxin-antitoxin module
MRVIERSTLRSFREKRSFADSDQPLEAWFREVFKADLSCSSMLLSVGDIDSGLAKDFGCESHRTMGK